MWIFLDVISDVQSQSCIKTKLARRRQGENIIVYLFVDTDETTFIQFVRN